MSGVVYFNFDIDIHNIQRTENVLTTYTVLGLTLLVECRMFFHTLMFKSVLTNPELIRHLNIEIRTLPFLSFELMVVQQCQN